MSVKISVIVPIYNMEQFIERAITCLKRQNMTALEFILINDGSTDKTGMLLTKQIQGDTRFRLFSIQNHGYGYGCNYGIAHAQGDYIAIYEPDDTITDDFYATLAETACRFPHADVLRYNGFYKNTNGTLQRLYKWEEKYTQQILDKYTMKRFWRSHPSVFNGIYRKNFLLQKNVLFCESPGASFQDAMFMVSLFYANPSIYIIDDIKYTYSIHNAQSINLVDTKIDAIIESWQKEQEWLHKNAIYDRNFFIYKMFTQFVTLSKKISSDNKNKLETAFKQLVQNTHLSGSIPKLTDKLTYVITW